MQSLHKAVSNKAQKYIALYYNIEPKQIKAKIPTELQ